MTRSKLFARIQALNVPARAKQLLEKLCSISSRLVEAILRFVQRHPGVEVVALAFAIAYFLQNIPVIGLLLGALIVALASVVALLEALKRTLAVGNNKE